LGKLFTSDLQIGGEMTSISYTNSDGINDSIEGAVISHSEVVDGWTRLYLMDGRAILFADCEAFAIVFSREILQ
jgi:phosphoketolase